MKWGHSAPGSRNLEHAEGARDRWPAKALALNPGAGARSAWCNTFTYFSTGREAVWFWFLFYFIFLLAEQAQSLTIDQLSCDNIEHQALWE